jgi:hypothetical protein
MKITKERLKKLTKEELQRTMKEISLNPLNWFKKDEPEAPERASDHLLSRHEGKIRQATKEILKEMRGK